MKWLSGGFVVWVFAFGIGFGGAVFGYVPATLHHAFSDMADADGNDVADSLEQYLAGSGFPPPAGYEAENSDLDGDGLSDFAEWVLGTDPLAVEEHGGPSMSSSGGTGVVMRMVLPDYFGAYAEVFGRESLLGGQWQVVEGWIPTYGADAVELVVSTQSNSAYFLAGFDATMDYDGDGYSDWMEHYISQTDDGVFDSPNDDGDELPDFWELKLFGDIWTQDGSDDSDGDLLLNRQELVWDGGIRVSWLSDPSLADTDGEGLGDGVEVDLHGTSPLLRDTDGDGRDDAAELLVLRTDPNNPDAVPPTVAFD